MISFDPRPMIKITPASSADDRRVQFFNYVEAVKALPINFPASEINPIIRRVNPKLLGQIRSIFIAITDDQYRLLRPKGSTPSASTASSAPPAPAAPAATAGTGSDQMSGIETGSSDTETEQDPIPVGPATSGRRTQKRGASTEASNPSKK